MNEAAVVKFPDDMKGSAFKNTDWYFLLLTVICFVVYGVIVKVCGLRMIDEDEFRGSDLTYHKITAYPEDHIA